MKNEDRIVQMPIRVTAKIRDNMKIRAVQKGLTLNELVKQYVIKCYESDG